ncbi:MAG: HNHc domain-containing protein [Oscillospiraceae bacterium]|jgi:putative restriction endonuclease
MSSIWLDEVIAAMKELGGDANYTDLYRQIEKRGNIDLSKRKHWKDRVRTTIEEFSSDSKAYNGKKDMFFSVEGIGKGHWGLRNFEPSENDVNLTEDDSGYPEGKQLLRKHICRERNPKVIYEAKKKFKESHNGKLFCEACGFSFTDTYGRLGEGFIEGHHKIPVRDLPDGAKTKVEDIIMLCSNCHRMIHRLKASENSLEELRNLLNKK